MKTFAGIDQHFAAYETAKILLQSIPYDGTSTWGKGADKGFCSFLEASENMELYDIETDSEVYKKGIHILKEITEKSNPKKVFEGVYQKTQKLLTSNKFLTFFGGEHSISIGIIKAFYEKYDSLTVLQLDAHADLRPSYMNSSYNHACALHDASKKTNLVQVGIRSMDASEKKYMKPSNVFFAEKMYGNNTWMDESIAKMTNEVYITLDLDVFDPSILPATGTPEPGGLLWNDMLTYLNKIFKTKNVVGFDIVELAPIKEQPASNFLAAKLYYKMLSYKFNHS
ncbi:MAG: agmatinase [Flavobacteriales bacterium]|nr:agmatinase [Flavobacteriales bacterium]